MKFLDDDFLLFSEPAKELFHCAGTMPIIDYHNHLCAKDIAEDRRFENLSQIWLEGDHYKWRAMRAHGVKEELISGRNTSDWDKFKAWAQTVPHTLRNPLYIWTHLELRRHFGITELLEETSAERIWENAKEQLLNGDLSARGILKKMRVSVLCTTDDPADFLEWHAKIAADGCPVKVYPTYRPDKAFSVDDPAGFNAWCDRLGATADVEIRDLDSLFQALDKRHDDFHAMGCRVSDHGLEAMFAADCTQVEARAIFTKVRGGISASPEERQKFGIFTMLHFGRQDSAKGWTKQLHLGPLRNLNKRLLQKIGADAGCDSIGDAIQGRSLAAYLGELEAEGQLPKTIIYNLNPADNQLFAAMAGNFQDESIPGKIQHGSAWWFLDQETGMRAQIEALSQLGLLSHFVGMLTDSRSFLSFPRHEYFRRILCSMLGEDVINGRLPDRADYLELMVKGICHDNAARYFGFTLGQASADFAR